jgi:hypothetical protein
MMIDHVEEHELRHHIFGGLAYIYLDYKERERQTLTFILASIVSQIFCQIPNAQKSVENLYQDCGRGQKAPDVEQLMGILTDILQSNKVLLAFDAMDEASAATRNALISRLASFTTDNLRVVFTSRPDVDFKMISGRTEVIDLVAQNSDLELFARTRLETNEDVQMILEECDEDIVSQILQFILFHAGGM